MTVPYYPIEDDTTLEIIRSLNYWELLAALIKAEIIDRRLYPRDELEAYAYRELSVDPESLDLDIVTMGSYVTNISQVKVSNTTFPPRTLCGKITDFFPTQREILIEFDAKFKDRHKLVDPRKLIALSELTKYKEEEYHGENRGDTEDGVESQSLALAPWLGGS